MNGRSVFVMQVVKKPNWNYEKTIKALNLNKWVVTTIGPVKNFE